ncbi:MAG: acetate--CoA ligase family protein [Nitrososphaerota archaeon]|uniref:acetate--CoA ligase family protein n=1 Tax=Candidatus Bathycorpusculum sp. TaxID=2994959 RepID=UPI0028344B55|nr:acetate--CoA ligase family protein [Candidatus Termiticorpusculum sp.]MCL2256797.1 acetate--CoA ligase family protein [Candidatus Termiticorpusculum sp.]MCL2293075.1 acetate--CoA ligase family protein [Candidatus Termiticorpusculum sp.]MDR0460510.1 acetate--CoA ligase family protein [Nitrososphaerota archaeon]
MSSTDKIIAQARSENRTALLESEAKTIMTEYGVSVPKFQLATNEKEAAQIAQNIGFPVVAKIVSPEIIHKSDAGGVKVGLKTAADVEVAYKTIMENAKKYNPNARLLGVLVMEMAPQGTEVIVGAIKDPQFGATIMFGLGGIFVEVLKDVTFKIAPVNLEEAKEMITGLKASALLKGYRNSPAADVDALAQIIVNVSKLLIAHPEIKELDLNPVLAYAKGASTVDARIIIE